MVWVAIFFASVVFPDCRGSNNQHNRVSDMASDHVLLDKP